MPNHCPQCGATLPSGALEGLCPACLLKQGVETGPPPDPVPFQPPSLEEVARLFPQLEIRAFIGKGGMGAVYQARQPALDRMVALKILPPQAAGGPGFAERFNREARALARLSHPNIVAVHEFGQAGGMPFFIMEFVDGLTLRQLERAARLSPVEALRIVPQICEALQFAHDQGVVHRDIKPENILIDKKGRVKIADFGIAKIIGGEGRAPDKSGLPAEGGGLDATLTGSRQAIGTPHYMAPEQLEKPQTVDHRADIFSLGVVFYEMLTGQLPLGRFAPPSRKVQIDARLDEVVLRAMESEPELRYQHASDVKTEIDTIASTPPGAPPSGDHMRPRMSQSAPPPAGSPNSRRHFLDWLPLIFFSMGMLAGLVGMAINVDYVLTWIRTNSILHVDPLANTTGSVATWVFMVFFLAMAVIFGLRVWHTTAKWVVAIAMLVLMVHAVDLKSQVDAENAGPQFGNIRAAIVNYRKLSVEGLVILFGLGEITSGVMGWLAKTRAKNRTAPVDSPGAAPANPSGEHMRPRMSQPAPPPAGSPHAPTSVFAWLALGFFIMGLIGGQLIPSLPQTEAWSPNLAPGEKPDFWRFQNEVEGLMNAHNYSEVLPRLQWFSDHGKSEFGYGVLPDFVISNWVSMGMRYPKALTALKAIRDRDKRDCAAGRGPPVLFTEALDINGALGDTEASRNLCKLLADNNPTFAQKVFERATDFLLGLGEYELCSRFMADPQARLDAAIDEFRKTRPNFVTPSQPKTPVFPVRAGDLLPASNAPPLPPPFHPSSLDFSNRPMAPQPPRMQPHAYFRFVERVCNIVEILIGTGHKADAKRIAAQAIAVLDEPRLRSAVADAEARIASRAK